MKLKDNILYAGLIMKSERAIWLIHSKIKGIFPYLQFNSYYFAHQRMSYKMEHLNFNLILP